MLISSDVLREHFSKAMSQMYRREVPAYGELMTLVAEVNSRVLDSSPELKRQFEATDALDRISDERHGAIRPGTAEEPSMMRRAFAVMGMFPVGYYDLSVAGLPVHSTAFRPIQETSLKRNPFRVFTSLLRLDLLEDVHLREEATAALAQRNIFTDRAVALIVQAETSGGLADSDADEFIAEREIIVAAGAINSPKLLMLSGIGATRHLASLGIKPAVDLPGVGQNLHDHLDIFMMYNVKDIESYDAYKKLNRQIAAGLRYAVYRDGPVSATVVEAGAFWSTEGTPDAANLQFHFLAGSGIEAVTDAASKSNGCTLNAYFLHPRSCGSMTLRSADPHQPPIIDPNFLAEQDDLDRTVESIIIGQEIMAQPAISRYIASQFMPGPGTRRRSDYEAYVRRESRSGYHPAGTCRMGIDEIAVVDPELRVRGIEGQRIADASIMPRLVSGNTNAPTIMIAEKASDMLRGRQVPPEASRSPARRQRSPQHADA